jgi:histidinol-phosphate aminotransferase
MSFSRRAFVRSLVGQGQPERPVPELISARGHEALVGEFGTDAYAQGQAEGRGRRGGGGGAPGIRLSSNENPLGPSAVALAAMEDAFVFAGRYPMNARPAMADLRDVLAAGNGLERGNVALAAGSGEVLETAVRAFTSDGHGLVSASPSYESPARLAERLGVPVVRVPVDGEGRLDLQTMVAEASGGAGLVFLCNPNNPTATVHGAQAIADTVGAIAAASPDTVILADEAYHEYVTDPNYASAVSLISQYPNLIVSRTMSKLHGMAGMRVGYAMGQPELIGRLTSWLMPYNVSAPAVGAAVASLQNTQGIADEQARNTAARTSTLDFFKSAGYETTDSQTNFIFVKLGSPAADFRSACREQGIIVGRDFPPMEKTWARISIGTQEEMDKAVTVFRSVLNV